MYTIRIYIYIYMRTCPYTDIIVLPQVYIMHIYTYINIYIYIYSYTHLSRLGGRRPSFPVYMCVEAGKTIDRAASSCQLPSQGLEPVAGSKRQLPVGPDTLPGSMSGTDTNAPKLRSPHMF